MTACWRTTKAFAPRTRISIEDKRRLDDHIAALSELDRKVKDSAAPPPAVCTAKRPASGASIGEKNVAEMVRDYGLLNDVIAMAFACGVSRIAAVAINNEFTDYSGASWHQDVAHQHTDPAKQALLVEANRTAFQAAMVDLAAKLDAYEDAPGVSVLDNTLVQWSQESGNNTHDNYAMTVVTFGSAGGFFKTGRFVDYRSRHCRPLQLAAAGSFTGSGWPMRCSRWAYLRRTTSWRFARLRRSRGSSGNLYAPEIPLQTGKPLPLITG